MRRLVWAFGWAGVALWSILCAVAYGLFDVVGRLSMRNADAFSADPETVEWIWKSFSFLHGLSTGAVGVVWALVSLLILAVPFFLDRALRPLVSMSGARPPAGRMPPGRAREDGIIDLAPDQYRVDPRPGSTAGPAPRIAPRR